MKIEDWFKGKNYQEGVAIYESSGKAKSHILRSLKRGKSSRNMALLIRELRKLKKGKSPSKKRHKTRVIKPEIGRNYPFKDSSPEKESQQNYQKNQSSKRYFNKVRYGELPKVLKLRFRELKDLFYDRCDLKFTLNDLEDNREKEALQLQIKIFEKEQQQGQIWKELDYWQAHKSLLPADTDDDFTKLNPHDLYLKKANIKSNLHKMRQRVDRWKYEAESENDKLERRKINEQISRTEKRMHEKEINLQKIEKILNDE